MANLKTVALIAKAFDKMGTKEIANLISHIISAFRDLEKTEIIEETKRVKIEEHYATERRKLDIVNEILLEEIRKKHEEKMKKIEEIFLITRLLIEKGKTEGLDKILMLIVHDNGSISKDVIELAKSILSGETDKDYVDIEILDE